MSKQQSINQIWIDSWQIWVNNHAHPKYNRVNLITTKSIGGKFSQYIIYSCIIYVSFYCFYCVKVCIDYIIKCWPQIINFHSRFSHSTFHFPPCLLKLCRDTFSLFRIIIIYKLTTKTSYSIIFLIQLNDSCNVSNNIHQCIRFIYWSKQRRHTVYLYIVTSRQLGIANKIL